MLTREFEDRIDIQVDNRFMMDQEIDAAVEEVMQAALRSRTGGILVSRVADGRFTVAVSELVPFGYTDQHDCRHPQGEPCPRAAMRSALQQDLHGVRPRTWPATPCVSIT
jgi:hypothetical protein